VFATRRIAEPWMEGLWGPQTIGFSGDYSRFVVCDKRGEHQSRLIVGSRDRRETREVPAYRPGPLVGYNQFGCFDGDNRLWVTDESGLYTLGSNGDLTKRLTAEEFEFELVHQDVVEDTRNSAEVEGGFRFRTRLLGITIDGDNTIWLSVSHSLWGRIGRVAEVSVRDSRIFRISAETGEVMGQLAPKIDKQDKLEPYGLAVTSGGNLLVCDGSSGDIRLLSKEGRLLERIGVAEYLPGYALFGAGMAIDKVDYIYVTSAWRKEVGIFSISSVHGRGHRVGRIEDEILQYPVGVGWVPENTLLVGDAKSGTIHRYDLN
jgi:sugar lactone lactonase YvrE